MYSVGIDTVSELVDSGTDVLIIEKEGVVEALGPYADDWGVALMYTRGFASEYAKELSETSGANVVLLTDFDPAGVMMGIDLPDVERIGIDFHTLEYIFGLEPITADSEIVKRLEEEYKQDKVDSHLVSLFNNEDRSVDYFMQDPNSNVRRRIEIDSVLKEAGNQRFWDLLSMN